MTFNTEALAVTVWAGLAKDIQDFVEYRVIALSVFDEVIQADLFVEARESFQRLIECYYRHIIGRSRGRDKDALRELFQKLHGSEKQLMEFLSSQYYATDSHESLSDLLIELQNGLRAATSEYAVACYPPSQSNITLE